MVASNAVTTRSLAPRSGAVTAGISAVAASRTTSGPCWVGGVEVPALSPAPQRYTGVRRGTAPSPAIGVELTPPALSPVEARAPAAALFPTASMVPDHSWLSEFAPWAGVSISMIVLFAPFLDAMFSDCCLCSGKIKTNDRPNTDIVALAQVQG